MITMGQVYDFLDGIAPFSTQMEFDNAGLLVGSRAAAVERILVSLDVTAEVVREAARRRCQLIVSHHPVIFHPLKTLDPGEVTGGVVTELVRRGIGVISAHTNLDVAPGGVNDVLLERLGAKVSGVLEPLGHHDSIGDYGLGRIGELPAVMEPKTFAAHVKRALGAKSVRAVAGERPVKTVAAIGGAGSGSYTVAAKLGADAYVSADAKYHEFLAAKAMGLTFIDAGHFATENPMMETLREWLERRYQERGVEVYLSRTHKEVYFSP